MQPKVFEKNPNAWYHSVEPKNRTVEFFVKMFEESMEDMTRRIQQESLSNKK